MCPIEALEEDVTKGLSSTHWVLGRVSVDRSTRWAQLSAALSHTFTSHLQILCGESQMAREEMQRPPLGLSPASIASVLIGEETLSFSLYFYPSVVPSLLCLSFPSFASLSHHSQLPNTLRILTSVFFHSLLFFFYILSSFFHALPSLCTSFNLLRTWCHWAQ